MRSKISIMTMAACLLGIGHLQALPLQGSSGITPTTFIDDAPTGNQHAPAGLVTFHAEDLAGNLLPNVDFEYSMDAGLTWSPAPRGHLFLHPIPIGAVSVSVRALVSGPGQAPSATASWAVVPAVDPNDAVLVDDQNQPFPTLGEGIYGLGLTWNATLFVDSDAPAFTGAPDGSYAKPFPEIQDAVDVALAGERIAVLPSAFTYRTFDIGASASAGTSSSPIAVVGTPGAVIKAETVADKNNRPMVVMDNDYWILQGLTIDADNNDPTPELAIRVDTGGLGKDMGNVVDSCLLLDHDSIGGISNHAIGVAGNAQETRISNTTIIGFYRDSPINEFDCHGVIILRGALMTKVLGNHIARCSGDGVQVDGLSGIQTNPAPEQIEIRRNHIHDHKENSVDVKSSELVWIEDNLMYGATGTPNYGQGTTVKVHHDAESVWIRRNHIHSTGFSAIDISTGQQEDANGVEIPHPGPEAVVIGENFLEGNLNDPLGGYYAREAIKYKVDSLMAPSTIPTKDLMIYNNIMLDWEEAVLIDLDVAEHDGLIFLNNAVLDNAGTAGQPRFGFVMADDPSIWGGFSSSTGAGFLFDGLVFSGAHGELDLLMAGITQPASGWVPIFAGLGVTLHQYQSGFGVSSMVGNDLSSWVLPASIANEGGTIGALMELHERGYLASGYLPPIGAPDVGVIEK